MVLESLDLNGILPVVLKDDKSEAVKNNNHIIGSLRDSAVRKILSIPAPTLRRDEILGMVERKMLIFFQP